MTPELFVIANAAEARLFTRLSPSDLLVPLQHLEHPQSRSKSSELGSASPGHGSSDTHSGGTSFAPRQTPHEKEALHFAHQIAHSIEQELTSGRSHGFVLFASSPFLGELNGALPASVRQHLRAEFEVDFTKYGLAELQERVDQKLSTLHQAVKPD